MCCAYVSHATGARAPPHTVWPLGGITTIEAPGPACACNRVSERTPRGAAAAAATTHQDADAPAPTTAAAAAASVRDAVRAEVPAHVLAPLELGRAARDGAAVRPLACRGRGGGGGSSGAGHACARRRRRRAHPCASCGGAAAATP